MYDVYLGGTNMPEWREQFKNHISPDVSVFDPFVRNFDENDIIISDKDLVTKNFNL